MTDEINPYNARSQPAALSEGEGEPPPTTADFMLELDDVVALTLISPAGRRQRRAVLVVLCVAWLAMAIVGWPALKRGLSVGGVLWLVFALAWSASFCPPAWRWRTRRACRKIYEDRLPWQQTIVISSDGIKAITPESEGRSRWQAIQGIAVTATHVFFFVNNAQALLVPARAFHGESQFHAFVAMARDFWAAATGKGMVCTARGRK